MEVGKFSFFVFVLFILDQVSKFYSLKIEQDIVLIPKIFSFVLVKNTGAAFGLFQNSNLILTIVGIIIVSIVIWNFKDLNKNKYNSVFSILILAGAFGNLFDRIFRGYVVDMVSVGFWPVFNLADSYICVGVIGVLIYYLYSQKYIS